MKDWLEHMFKAAELISKYSTIEEILKHEKNIQMETMFYIGAYRGMMALIANPMDGNTTLIFMDILIHMYKDGDLERIEELKSNMKKDLEKLEALKHSLEQ